MKPIPIEEYKQAMRDAVCTVCVCFSEDAEGTGRCIHEESGQCMLFLHMDEVVDLVSKIQSNSIEAYEEVLRGKVCAKCLNQDENGFCKLRDSHDPVPTWCILDAYFNLVVGATESVQAAHGAA